MDKEPGGTADNRAEIRRKTAAMLKSLEAEQPLKKKYQEVLLSTPKPGIQRTGSVSGYA